MFAWQTCYLYFLQFGLFMASFIRSNSGTPSTALQSTLQSAEAASEEAEATLVNGEPLANLINSESKADSSSDDDLCLTERFSAVRFRGDLGLVKIGPNVSIGAGTSIVQTGYERIEILGETNIGTNAYISTAEIAGDDRGSETAIAISIENSTIDAECLITGNNIDIDGSHLPARITVIANQSGIIQLQEVELHASVTTFDTARIRLKNSTVNAPVQARNSAELKIKSSITTEEITAQNAEYIVIKNNEERSSVMKLVPFTA